MNTLGTLLVPIDETNPSECAVTFALDLASRFGSRLIFCHAVDLTGAVAQGATPYAVVDVAGLHDILAKSGRTTLDAALERARTSGIAAEAIEPEGNAVGAILEAAAAKHADAIVIGTHARTGAARFLAGSIAEGVLRNSDLPVFVAHAPARASLGRIAVALDDSTAAQAALDFALELAVRQHASLLLVHAVDGRAPEKLALACDLVDAASAKAQARGIATEAVVCPADAAACTLDAVRSRDVDLVAVGTHGRDGIVRALLGSVAESIIRQSPVPVVAMRATVKAAAAQRHSESRAFVPAPAC